MKVMRMRTAKAAALGPVDMRPTTGGGGTLINVRGPDLEGSGGDLEAEADDDHAEGEEGRGAGCRWGYQTARAWAIAAMEVDPVAPKARAIP